MQAADAGLPAFAGIEPLIVAELGNRYSPHDMGTTIAGSIVGEVMRRLGCEPYGRGDMPSSAVAKAAATWKSRKRQ